MAATPAASSRPIAEHLSQHQIDVLIALERTGGSISLIAVMFIFLAYALVRRVRNVQNTFIVFASVSNVGASIASIIALDGLEEGKGTPLCQTQSFLFEMFMQSDPWWSLAMAINVFLVFYYRTSPDSFRRWWWLYCLICYGGPFVIALTLLLIKNPDKGPVYGEATIWCWVDPAWDSVRIYSYYMLIWICIVGSIVCYFLVGYHVFRSRNRLRSFPASKSREAGHYEQAIPNHAITRYGFYGTVTTEVQVVHTSASTGALPLAEPKAAHMPTAGQVSIDTGSDPERAAAAPAQYYSNVTSAAPRLHTAPSPLTRVVTATSRAASKFVIDDPIKRAYLRTSLLFAISVLVTWIPSSLNRIHGWLDGTSPYEYHVATAAVLPLQGLWNFLIFFITSWAVVKQRIRGKTTEVSQRSREDAFGTADRTVDRERAARRDDTESDDIDSRTMGSAVELRRVPDRPAKTSTSL
ncbi:Cyclic AMP receptor-like protein A [Tolypocladium ophioglossoides CBS 100239]|uniref:Cyclic AMP receptor-like protein A n=1 Tax=Tolypocladium ophioglossoides (strain CBS 100239) TaxID=1163406 RepID=A0A0L0NFW4_TOLOC|nr:Cyclic AMP receptor-like protein A [Tolypocladium ophioglossoides CBS 100239]